MCSFNNHVKKTPFFNLIFIYSLSIIPLLRPFVWQGPLIPILPLSLIEYLQAPVPFIVGILKLPEDIEKDLANAFILRVDTEEVKLPENGFPLLPKLSRL